MSMVINLVEDHNIYLCEGGPVYNGGVQPTPITYLTQWKIVGNSEVHGSEIWSCGEYNATDGKYHILVQPQGGSIADIALTEPLRKVNDVADSIEFPSNTDGKALVTRAFGGVWIKDITNVTRTSTTVENVYRFKIISYAKGTSDQDTIANILCNKYSTTTGNLVYTAHTGIASYTSGNIYIYDADHNTTVEDFINANLDTEVIYELVTPTTELVDAPQIEEAESYTCVISQGGKAVSWSSFETDSE